MRGLWGCFHTANNDMKEGVSIIGHARQCEQLSKDIEKDNVSHAYLFAGYRHLGKMTVAKWFVQQLLTHGQGEIEEEQTIRLIGKNIHPDLLILDQLWMEDGCTDWNVIAKSSNVPQAHREKDKLKTNTIGIDDIRALQERLHETSQSGKTCCIIRSAERLHITAANALLKILEEPPPHVVFCFTTESLSSLPLTVVSRMRILRFSPLSAMEMLPLVKNLPEEDRSLLLDIAQGAPGIVLQSLDDPDRLRKFRQAHNDALRFLESPSLLERFQQLSNAMNDTAQISALLQHAFLHLQAKLRSEDVEEAERARDVLAELFPLLHTLQSNTNKPLLAAHTALRCSPLRS